MVFGAHSCEYHLKRARRSMDLRSEGGLMKPRREVIDDQTL
jgi:hypothetical protein